MALEDLERIFSQKGRDLNARINAFVTYNERAPQEASEALRKGLEPLPIGVKDVIMTRGLRTTMCSRVFENHVPSEDAAAVKILRRAGWAVVGKTNTHEFAMGPTNTSSIFGPARNPVDPERIAGGSSGGSAAAVAAGLVPAALGTDTLGSVRIPASLCGVYGFKPTHGAVSLEGVFPLSPTLDTVGFIARDLEWVERLLSTLVPGRRRRSSSRRPTLAIPRWFRAPEGVRRGFEDLVAKVEDSFLDRISGLDLECKEIEMEVAERVVWDKATVVRYVEGTRVHLRLRDKWDLYFPDVRRVVERGLRAALGLKAVDYLGALRAREEAWAELGRVLKRFDALATPTTLVPAPRIDEVVGREDGPVRGLLTYETIYASFLGVPAISVPGLVVDGMPVGIQLIGGRGRDWDLLDVARRIAESLPGPRPASL